MPAIIVLSVIAGVGYGLALLTSSADHDDCHNKGELAQVQVTYRTWDGCYVNQNGLWIPFDVWKYNRDHGIKM